MSSLVTGECTCSANNTIGSLTTRTNITVLVSPEVISRPKDVEIGYRGRNKTLPCRIFGFPPPNVTWSGPSITRRKAVSVQSGLLITNVQYLDSGNHYCRASNSLGSVELKTLFIVHDVGTVEAHFNCGYAHRDTGSTGYITSPNYPSMYGNGLNCYWKLRSNARVRLTFSDFRTESISYDIVTIYDGPSSSSRQLGKYGGTSGPSSPIVSSSNYLYLTFTTDGSGAYKGFKASYNWMPI